MIWMKLLLSFAMALDVKPNPSASQGERFIFKTNKKIKSNNLEKGLILSRLYTNQQSIITWHGSQQWLT